MHHKANAYPRMSRHAWQPRYRPDDGAGIAIIGKYMSHLEIHGFEYVGSDLSLECDCLMVEATAKEFGGVKHSWFTEEQETGLKMVGVCCCNCISDAIFYKWDVKYGGMAASEARPLKAMEEKNAGLKKLLRLYRAEGLWVRRRAGRKQALGTPVPLWSDGSLTQRSWFGTPQLRERIQYERSETSMAFYLSISSHQQ